MQEEIIRTFILQIIMIKFLENKNINVIFITTRHNLHFPMIIKALKAGKNVFCEKPLCITKKELSSIKNFLKDK